MNIKGLILLISICCSYLGLKGQDEKLPLFKKNTVYAEFAGTSGSISSVNYDRILLQKEGLMFNLTLGIGYFPSINNWNPIIGLPVTFNASFGKAKHHFELGTGLTYNSGLEQSSLLYYQSINTNNSNTNVKSMEALFWTFRIGYKLQKPNGGLFLRGGFTPLINIKTFSDFKGESNFIPAFGAGIGYTF